MKTSLYHDNIRGVTVGVDCEMALWHTNLGQYIPATSFNTPGQKGEYVDIEYGDKVVGTYHRDNITVEFQSIPASTAGELYHNLCMPVKGLTQHYREFIGAELHHAACVHYDDPEMLMVPEAQEMGCEPDYCAYSGEEVKGPTAESLGPWRVCSGHIHIGHSALVNASFEDKCAFIRLLDYLVGVWAMPTGSANSWRRRFFYGQAGRFRVKPYGVEYRTPDSYWLDHVTDDVWDMVMMAFELWITYRDYEFMEGMREQGITEEKLRRAIDNPLDKTLEEAVHDPYDWRTEYLKAQDIQEAVAPIKNAINWWFSTQEA